MKLDFNNEKSIYLQIAESIEDDIIRGVIEEETQIPSTNQMAVIFEINPATAGKVINLLVDRGILYKRRGIGMFVAAGAKKVIQEERRSSFYDKYVTTLLDEAKKLPCSLVLQLILYLHASRKPRRYYKRSGRVRRTAGAL
ncbi:MAG: GntR family transcriptional regulator [Clostridiaceae bacterium]|nr:GntR family transcriptional regulator [Clostridiaceae bacterium]